MTAAAKKTRTALVGGTEHTDASLEAMKTGDIAALVASIRGGNPPKPATKAKAIELFWKAAESIPETPEVPDSKAEALEATTEVRGTEKGAPDKTPKVKRYAIRTDGPEQAVKIAATNPVARRLAQEIRDAGQPLSMAECSAIVGKFSKSGRPDKLVAWHFCKLYRPAGILVESRNGRGA
jgi:hypothetical protein